MSNNSLLAGWRQKWNKSLFQFLGRRGRTRVDIEDLAQETYLRLLRARDLGDVRNPQAYLLRVASHVVSEWRNHHPPEEMFEGLDDNALVDDLVHKRVVIQAFEHFLGRMVIPPFGHDMRGHPQQIRLRIP